MRVVRVDGDPARVLADEDAHDAARLARSRGGVDRRGSSLVEVHLDDEVRGGCHRPAHVAPVGAWIVGVPASSRSTLTMKFEADATAQPTSLPCSNAIAHGTPTNSRVAPGGSKLMPRFMLMVCDTPPAVPPARVARSTNARD